MPDIFDRVLPLNLIANTVIFYVAARLYLLPLVSRLRPQQILVPILLFHSTRHLGMMFLTRGATYPGLPPEFAYPAAFGDLVTAMIAFFAIPLVLRGSALARPIVWTFNIFGTADLLAAITIATICDAPVAMGPAYWIPALLGPTVIGDPLRDVCSSPTPPGGVETLHASYALILFLDSVGAKDDLAGGANYSAPKIFCTSASKRGSPRSGSRLGSILMYPML